MKSNDFDIISYLQSRNIPFSTSGNNVASGWVGIRCVFCIDHSNHLGINLYSKGFNCLKCGETGNVVKLIQEIDGIPLNKALGILKEFSSGTPFSFSERKYQSLTLLPIGAKKKFPDAHLEYLRKRRFSEREIALYDLYAVGPVGPFNHRIIIPVTMNYRSLGFVGKDITGKSDIPYLNSSPESSIKDVKQCLYNMDNVLGNTVIIVEGIFDAWRIGDGAVATLGTKYTKEQLRLLKSMDRAFVLFDADAVPLAYKLAYDLSSFVKEIKVLELSEGDPDNLHDDDVRALRKEIGI